MAANLPVELILQVSSGAGFAMGLRAADRGDPLDILDRHDDSKAFSDQMPV